ncbi:MAG: carboxypeptidase regulatory-like domain-containing protein [Gemmatimonadota bacterium]
MCWAAVGLPGTAEAQEWRPGESRTEANAHLQGQVVDRATGLPVSLVGVRLRPEGQEAWFEDVTDEQGRFLFSPLVPGVYRLEVVRLGYETIAESVDVTPVSEIRVVVELSPDALPLEGIVVTTIRRSRLEANGFYERRQRRPGTFITRDQIEARGAYELSQILGGVPMLRAQQLPGGRGAAVVGRGGCIPDYYVDGVRLVDSATLDFEFLPGDIEAMEVYSSVGAPPQYSGSRCGTILLWTRQPGPGEPQRSILARTMVGVVFIIASFLVTR